MSEILTDEQVALRRQSPDGLWPGPLLWAFCDSHETLRAEVVRLVNALDASNDAVARLMQERDEAHDDLAVNAIVIKTDRPDLRGEVARLAQESDALREQVEELTAYQRASEVQAEANAISTRLDIAELDSLRIERDALKADSKRLAEVLALVEASPVTLTAAAESYAPVAELLWLLATPLPRPKDGGQ